MLCFEAATAPITIFLSRLVGLSALCISLAVVLHKRATVDAVVMLFEDRPVVFILGAIGLIAGLAMVLAHNIWSGGLLPVLVTLTGWIILIRGALLLILPHEAIAAIFAFIRFEQLFYVYAAMIFLFGAYLTHAGFKAPLPPRVDTHI